MMSLNVNLWRAKTTMKCVMVINPELPLGLIANTAAVLAISLGAKIDGIVGEDVLDQAGTVHRGLTTIPIPLLKGNSDVIRSLRTKLLTMGDLYFVDFCDAAQQSKHYDEFTSRLMATSVDNLSYLGIAICGPEREVKSLTGSLALLR
jgi:hypothetical protein